MQTLKQLIPKLNTTRDKALELVGETLGLAADAGDLIAKAKADGQDLGTICRGIGITEHTANGYIRVSSHRLKLKDSDPSNIRQQFLWAGLLPESISVSTPGQPKPFMDPIVRAAQWLANRGEKFIKNDSELKNKFLKEAEPIVKLFNDCMNFKNNYEK
jgi:hypothetical protein